VNGNDPFTAPAVPRTPDAWLRDAVAPSRPLDAAVDVCACVEPVAALVSAVPACVAADVEVEVEVEVDVVPDAAGADACAAAATSVLDPKLWPAVALTPVSAAPWRALLPVAVPVPPLTAAWPEADADALV
jgi:hypothetical protein